MVLQVLFFFADGAEFEAKREISHIEMVCTLVYQLTRNLSVEEIKRQGFDKYFVDHTTGIYPVAASGEPYTAATIRSTGDVIKFLRAREIVHYQRFGEGLRFVTDKLDCKNFYAFNPSFDKPKK